ncbi:MAG: hypothetical protein QM703_17690 [Gemmatales bacterium]
MMVVITLRVMVSFVVITLRRDDGGGIIRSQSDSDPMCSLIWTLISASSRRSVMTTNLQRGA